MLNMRPSRSYPRSRGRSLVAGCLAALLATSVASAQTSDADSLRRLQDENAALRARLAALEGSAPTAPTAAPTATTTSPAPAQRQASLAMDDGVQRLSPFEVTSSVILAT